MFWLDESLGASIYLDGIITVIDAVNIDKSLDTHDNQQHDLSTAHLQISHADVLLVNKIDLASVGMKRTVMERVRSINSLAKVFETEFSRIGLDVILDLHAYDEADLSVNNFSRDSAGHLDHVRISFRNKTDDSIYPRSPTNFLRYLRYKERSWINGFSRYCGRECYLPYLNLNEYQYIEQKDESSQRRAKNGYYKV